MTNNINSSLPSDHSPYIGLRPFTEAEQALFFGRDDEIHILSNKILANRLTLLVAASGVGKSSLLRAGVIPALQNSRMADFVYHNDWAVNPSQDLKSSIVKCLKDAKRINQNYQADFSLSLAEFLNLHSMLLEGKLILFLDQFEEFFNYQKHRNQLQAFVAELAEAMCDTDSPCAFVLSMREDFAMELNAFKSFLKISFEQVYRIEKLSPEAAQLAIVHPVEKFGFAYQDGLVGDLLEDLGRREREGRSAAEQIDHEAPLQIEPPHLQIVCQQLWLRSYESQDRLIKTADYEALGKAEGILKRYFKDKMLSLSIGQKALASRAFDHLVSQHGAKMAYPLEELAKLLAVDEQALEQTLELLHKAAILRRTQRQERMWYELYHDIFAKSIADWNQAYKLQQLRWRVAKWGSVFVVAVVLVFVAYDGYENFQARHFRLGRETVSERIEVYQGKLGSSDLFSQTKFNYESDFERSEIEADKRFETEQISELKNSQAVQVGELPLASRFAGYATAGLFENADKVFNNITKAKDNNLYDLITQLANVRIKESTKRLLTAALLKDNNVNVRLVAINALTGLKAEKEIPQIVPLLKDNDAYVRRAAINALTGLKAEKAIPQIVPLLKDNNAYVRQAAINALTGLKAEKETPQIVPLLKDNDAYVREAAINALTGLKAEKEIPQIVPLLKDNDANVREAAINALTGLKAEKEIPQIVPLLKDNDALVRQAAINALTGLKAEKETPQIVPLLKDNDADVRRAAINALTGLKAEKEIPQIVPLLKDNEAYVREAAINALTELKAEKETPQIVPLLKDNEANVRRAAIEVLGNLKVEKAIEPIIALLKDNDYGVRYAAIKALSNLKVEKAIEPIIALLKDNDWQVRSAAVEALTQLKAEKAIEPIIALLKDNNSDVRSAAIEVLGNLKVEKAIEPIIALLKDNNSNVRYAAENALQRFKIKLFISENKTSITGLSKRLDGQYDKEYQNTSALELSKLQPQLPALTDWQEQQITDLEKALKDGTQEKTAIADDLGYVVIEKAVSLLIPMLKDEDNDVITKAVSSLSRIGEIHPEWLLPYSQQILESIKKVEEDLDETDIIKIQAELIATVENDAIEKHIFSIIQDPTQPNYLRFTVLESLENSNRPDIGDLLVELLLDPKHQALEWPITHLLAKLPVSEARKPKLQTELRNRFTAVEKAKDIWREKRDSYKYKQTADNEAVITEDRNAPKAWQDDYKIYQYAYALARIAPADDGIELLNHPLYQARQAAIRALAEKADSNLIKQLVEYHKQFNPEDFPSPLPYSTYQAIDKALEQVEYTGTAQDLAILKQIKGSDITTQMKDQQRAINERFDWTIAELEYRLKEKQSAKTQN